MGDTSGDGAHTGQDKLASISEAVLEQFSAAVKPPTFDERLFEVTAGGNLVSKLEEVFAAVRSADAALVVRSQRALPALLGADVETQMAFALARKQAKGAIVRAQDAAAKTTRLIGLLEHAQASMAAEISRLEQLHALGLDLVSKTPPATTPEAKELLSRFKRQLSNLQSLRAASMLALQRLPQAVTRNRQILGRFNEIEDALFPVWERHAVAVLQAPKEAARIESVIADAAKAIGTRVREKWEAAA